MVKKFIIILLIILTGCTAKVESISEQVEIQAIQIETPVKEYINFDEAFEYAYINDDSGQLYIDNNYIVNWFGIWMHHSTDEFLAYFNDLDIEHYIILDNNEYKYIRTIHALCDGWNIETDEGWYVPAYTNNYIITCADGEQYGDYWGVYVAILEE